MSLLDSSSHALVMLAEIACRDVISHVSPVLYLWSNVVSKPTSRKELVCMCHWIIVVLQRRAGGSMAFIMCTSFFVLVSVWAFGVGGASPQIAMGQWVVSMSV